MRPAVTPRAPKQRKPPYTVAVTEVSDEQFLLYPWYGRPERPYKPVHDMRAYAPATGEVLGGCVGHLFGPFIRGANYSAVYLTTGLGTLGFLASGLLIYVRSERRRASRRKIASFFDDLERIRR